MAGKAGLTHGAYLLPRQTGPTLPWGMLAFAAAALLGVAGAYYAQVHGLRWEAAVLAGALILTVVALLYLHVSYRKILRALHRGILHAQEGMLRPVAVGRVPDGFLRRFSSDHNSLIASLGATFSEMEECQNRVIGERNRNEAILQSLPGALLCVDGDQRINLCNRQAENLFGPGRDAMLGRNLFDLFALHATGREMLRDAFLYEWPVVNKEILLHIRSDARYFALNLSFFKSSNLNETGAVVILEDITEYKRLQEHIYAADKLAAMGQLAAGVAHELNTPLGNIIGYARLIDEAHGNAEQVARYTHVVSQEARRCARIVEDLLNYARRDRCVPETCELNAIVREVVETIVQCQGRRFDVDVVMSPSPGELSVVGSPGQLDIVLVNLIMNSIQAAAGRAQPRVTVVVQPHGERQAGVVVEDNGPGVAPELRRRIFDPFFTTKEVGQGTGLGLAISQAIVTKLGGSLRYDESYRGGARFVLSLPFAGSETNRGG